MRIFSLLVLSNKKLLHNILLSHIILYLLICWCWISLSFFFLCNILNMMNDLLVTRIFILFHFNFFFIFILYLAYTLRTLGQRMDIVLKQQFYFKLILIGHKQNTIFVILFYIIFLLFIICKHFNWIFFYGIQYILIYSNLMITSIHFAKKKNWNLFLISFINYRKYCNFIMNNYKIQQNL